MGLSLAQRQAVSVATTTRYKREGKAAKGRMLDELWDDRVASQSCSEGSGGGADPDDCAAENPDSIGRLSGQCDHQPLD